jgi:hypothetical protein
MQMQRRFSKTLAATTTAVLVAALLAAGAFAAVEQTRESYVAQVEPICKKNTKANEKILAGVRQQIKQGKLQLAAGKFAQASSAFGKAVNEIRAVPQPAADTAKLTKWLGFLNEEKVLLGKIGKALKQGKKPEAQTLSVKLTHNGNLANNSVLGFEFNYCLIDSSRFS